MTRRLNLALLALLLLVGLPFWWLLLDTRPSDAKPHDVSIAQLRQLASTMPGKAPSQVRVEIVSGRRLPGNFVAAGSGFKRQLIGRLAFQLPVEGGGGVVIDTGMSEQASRAIGDESFDWRAQARIDAALREAALVLATGESEAHLAGLANLAAAVAGNNASILRVFKGNARQRAALGLSDSPTDGSSGHPYAIAPGIAAVPAPSHTPGTQMIYVRLDSGAEYLFAGGVAALARNWMELRGRSRLYSDYVDHENRREVFAWLLTIRRLKAEAPALHIVPGNDFSWLTDRNNASGVVRYFNTDSARQQAAGQ